MDKRREPGGIIAAATILVDHRGALEYELLTRTRYTLDDIGGRLTWPALYSFISYLPPGNALCDDPALRAWYGGQYTADLLADLIDVLATIATRGKAKPYKRPTDKYRNGEKRKVGSGAIPVREFDAWWNGRS